MPENRRAAIPNRAPLNQNTFNLLPLGAIEPRGWLHQQLEIQAQGLTGHLDEFWKDVGSNSGWLGGIGESWERGPYYLDGLLPLAYQLGDKRLIDKAKRWVDWTLDHQRADSQIGPVANEDWWPRMLMLKVLTQYQEATGDPRVVPLMTKYFKYELKALAERPLRIGDATAGKTLSTAFYGFTIEPVNGTCLTWQNCCTSKDTTGRHSSLTSITKAKWTDRYCRDGRAANRLIRRCKPTV
ncbi:MAG: hypothetical protein ACJ746_26020 [Bryobacteraceae bacterium]